MSTGEGGGASRSTDPASGTSAATDVSLREYLTSLIVASERRADARFDAMKEMMETAFQSAQEAINKAEAATDRRLEGMNEFRDTLSDQATQFVTKESMTATIARLEAMAARNRQDIDALNRRIDLREGAISGSRLTYGNMAALVAAAATIIGIIVVTANYLSAA